MPGVFDLTENNPSEDNNFTKLVVYSVQYRDKDFILFLYQYKEMYVPTHKGRNNVTYVDGNMVELESGMAYFFFKEDFTLSIYDNKIFENKLDIVGSNPYSMYANPPEKVVSYFFEWDQIGISDLSFYTVHVKKDNVIRFYIKSTATTGNIMTDFYYEVPAEEFYRVFGPFIR